MLSRSFAAFAAVSLAALSITTGCGHPARPASAPAEAAQEADPSDPSFTPPDESGVVFVDKPGKQKALGEKSERNEKNAPVRNLPSANAQKPASGSLHPAKN